MHYIVDDCRQSNLLSIHVVMIDVDYLMASVFVQDIPRKDDEIVPIISEIGMIAAQYFDRSSRLRKCN